MLLSMKQTKLNELKWLYFLLLFLLLLNDHFAQAQPLSSCICTCADCSIRCTIISYNYRCDCFNCSSNQNPCDESSPCLPNGICTNLLNTPYTRSYFYPIPSSAQATQISPFVFTGIISIIPVLLIGLVVIIVTVARLLKCWKNSNISNRRTNRSQQVVFTTDQFNANDSTNGSILDYNQALSCSVKIEKDPNDSKFKEDMLPTYNDALKMKTFE